MNSFKVLFQHLPGGSEKNHEHSIAGTSRMWRNANHTTAALRKHIVKCKELEREWSWFIWRYEPGVFLEVLIETIQRLSKDSGFLDRDLN
jgi:hypothetical protein